MSSYSRSPRRVSHALIARMLDHQGYSLQGNRKTKDRGHHLDRNAQLEFMNQKTKQFQDGGMPVISVDTKKKENLGTFKNAGSEYRPKEDPVAVNVHDVVDKNRPLRKLSCLQFHIVNSRD
jgi:hypothetical protein